MNCKLFFKPPENADRHSWPFNDKSCLFPDVRSTLYWQTCLQRVISGVPQLLDSKKQINSIWGRTLGLREKKNSLCLQNDSLQVIRLILYSLTHTLTHTHLCLYLSGCNPSNFTCAVYRLLWKSAKRLHPLPQWLYDTSPVMQCPLSTHLRDLSTHQHWRMFSPYPWPGEHNHPLFWHATKQWIWCILCLANLVMAVSQNHTMIPLELPACPKLWRLEMWMCNNA